METAKNNTLPTIISGEELILRASHVNFREVRQRPDLYPRVRDSKPDEAVRQMNALVLVAYMLTGQKAEADDVRFTSQMLLDAIMDDNEYGSNCIAWIEVAHAFKRGCMETEVFRVCPSSLFRMIVKYCKGEGHEAAKC